MRNRKIKKENRIITIIFTWTFLLSFAWVFFNIIFFNTNDLVHFRMIRSTFLGCFILGVFIFLFVLIKKYKDKLTYIDKNWKVIMLVTFIVMFILQLLYTKAIYFNPGWDIGGVIDHAQNLVSNPEAFDHTYFMFYPNNLFLMLIFSKVYKLSLLLGFIDYRFLLIVINIIMVDLTIGISVMISKKLYGKKAGIITFLFFLTLFAFSPWLTIPYSDTLCMLFPVLIFYIYLKQKEIKFKWKKCLCFIFIGVLGLIGFQIKPTAIIVIIAIFIVEFINSIKDRKKIIRYVAMILLFGVGVFSAKVVYDNFTEGVVVNGHNLDDRENMEVPFTHYMMMGMQSVYVENRGSIYGVYSEEDVHFTNNLPTHEAKIQGNIEEIKRRLNDFGVKGYVRFLNNKLCWMLSDGTFYYGGEGNFMREEPYSTSQVSKNVQNIVLHNGEYYYNFANILQGFWVAILFLIVLPLFIKDKEYDNTMLFIMRVTITGIIVFLSFFEGRSRYFINHIPFFILLATYGFCKLNIIYLEYTKTNEVN